MAAERVTYKRLQEHRQALADFLAAYTVYLGSNGDGPARSRVNQLIPAADAAIDAIGMGLAVLPPAASGGGPVIRHLANVAFLHEKPGFRPLPDAPPTYEHVVDVAEQALAQIDEREKALRRLRGRPLYWLDRAIRALLAIPAYLIGVLIGVPTVKIQKSAWGIPLRLLAAASEAVAIYAAGRALKWW